MAVIINSLIRSGQEKRKYFTADSVSAFGTNSHYVLDVTYYTFILQNRKRPVTT